MLYNLSLNLKQYSKALRSPKQKMIKLFVIVVLIEITSGASIEPTDDLVTGNLIARQATSFTCPENMRGNYCADDCKTLLTCARTTNVPAEIRTCSTMLPSRPFCIPGARSCSVEGNSTITSCLSSSKFVCTNTGYFPDPSHCNQYHVCTDESSETYECPPRYIYDAAKFKCKRRRLFQDCRRINCARSQKKYVVYPTRKSYYAFCGLDGEITMFRCADTDNFEFNPEIVDCVFVCKAEGTYPDYNNMQQFYECYRSRGRFISRIQTCPAKYVFDPVLKLCVKNTATTTVKPTTSTEPITTTDITTTTTLDITPPNEEITTTTDSSNSSGSTDTTDSTGESTSKTDLDDGEMQFTAPPIEMHEIKKFSKQESVYSNSALLSHSDLKAGPSSERPTKSTLIEWLLHSI